MFTKVLQEFTHLARRRDLQEAKGIDALTDREKDVLRLVARGATNRDIAEELVITENTVKVHLRNILDKLQLRNRQQAAAYAVQEGLISRVIPGNSMYSHPYGSHSSSTDAYNLKVVRAQETRSAHSGRRDFIDLS
jgi:DNA-binding CsgD family transcriptional regulator